MSVFCKNSRTNRMLFNDDWQFIKTDINARLKDVLNIRTKWYDIEIPHDWLINDTNNLYETSKGWYKKSFIIEERRENEFYICFDGVYMDYKVYVNGKKVGEWKYGYSAYNLNITKFVSRGENEIVVEVLHQNPNSRWYSGAGIYRNVWLKQARRTHFAPNGIYITTDGEKGKVHVECEIFNNFNREANGEIILKLFDYNGAEIATSREEYCILENSIDYSSQNLYIDNPQLWSLENPNLYFIEASVFSGGRMMDRECVSFGFRDIEFNPDEGFFLNNKYHKLKGVCLHHDLGALGAAFNTEAAKRQLSIMKSMGVNAIRTSHNMPASEFLDLCDEMGFLVVNEAFDIWEKPKNPFDYARFFPEWYKKDVESWIKRDRNHPSVIMWSLGNEIYDTHFSERGLEVTKMLRDVVLAHDPYENAKCTIGSNFMQWENAQKCANEVKLAGYNYAEGLYDEHHKNHPDWIIYGSETASTVSSRGIYHFPADVPALTHDDMQCSSLGNSVVAWGALYEKAWQMDRDRKYCLGQFVWTGIDYIGEPTPYKSKNSFFGAVDTAGLPKEAYYFYQSVWTDPEKSPMVHISPYWDWNEGEIIDVIVYSNLDRVELFLNGISLGEKLIDHKKGETLHAKWKVPYEKGTLEARAYNKDGIMAASDFKHSFTDAVKLVLKPNKEAMLADGRDLIFVEISVIDKDGNPVENAVNRVKVEVNGAARLVGLDNGDSTDYDSYKGDNRRLFSGKLVAILQSKLRGGKIQISAEGIGLESAMLELYSGKADLSNTCGISVVNAKSKGAYPTLQTEYTEEVPIRTLKLSCDSKNLNEKFPEALVKIDVYPKNATYNDISVKVVKENGVVCTSAIAELIMPEKDKIVVKALGDGNFRLRVMANNGAYHPRVISEMTFTASGLGSAVKMPYDFISASFFDYSNSALKIIENGALGGFEGCSSILYKSYDFGNGTNELILHIGNTTQGDVPIELWLGDCDNGGKHIITANFPHNGRWDGFSPVKFALPEKIIGVHDICFVIKDRIIFGGFEFKEINKAYEKNLATNNIELYGDNFEISGNNIERIGNNVTISFGEMNFGAGTSKIIICGRTPNEKNTIQLRYVCDNGTRMTQVLEFNQSADYVEREFDLNMLSGRADISFVFLPGSNFDFSWFKFIKNGEE